MIIYQIKNELTNDIYIGKTTRTLSQRYYSHKYTALKSQSQSFLHRAMRKYGTNNFHISILDECCNLDELNQKEKFWINHLQPRYNMTKGGDGGDTSNSPNFIKSMKKYHGNKDSKTYATYGMLGKKQSNKFFESIKKSNCCPVMCEGKKFDSVGEAQKYYPGISIRKRLDNKKYPDFFRLREKTIRK